MHHIALRLSSKLKPDAFPGLIDTHTEASKAFSAVALSVFHLPLEEGNVPSVVKELEYHISLGGWTGKVNKAFSTQFVSF